MDFGVEEEVAVVVVMELELELELMVVEEEHIVVEEAVELDNYSFADVVAQA